MITAQQARKIRNGILLARVVWGEAERLASQSSDGRGEAVVTVRGRLTRRAFDREAPKAQARVASRVIARAIRILEKRPES